MGHITYSSVYECDVCRSGTLVDRGSTRNVLNQCSLRHRLCSIYSLRPVACSGVALPPVAVQRIRNTPAVLRERKYRMILNHAQLFIFYHVLVNILVSTLLIDLIVLPKFTRYSRMLQSVHGLRGTIECAHALTLSFSSTVTAFGSARSNIPRTRGMRGRVTRDTALTMRMRMRPVRIRHHVEHGNS